MTKRMVAPMLFGIVGCAMLLAMGVWQVQRLMAKQGLLAQIEARIGAVPVGLPVDLVRDRDMFLPVVASGTASPGLRVLVSVRPYGPGYRMISVFETGGRRVLLDRGYLSVEDHTDFAGPNDITVTGNLQWPLEVDGFTPEPDRETGLWFARDVDAMAAELQTEPVLIVARSIEPEIFTSTPLPVSSESIRNNHLGYALTWFSLAIVWAGMTVYLLARMRQQSV